MIKDWFKSISSGYLWIATGILIAIVLAYIYSLNYKINSLRAKLAESNSQVVILSSTIDLQNNAIKVQGEDTARLLKISDDAVKLLKRSQSIKQSKINSLESLLGKISTCDAAVVEAKKSL